MYHQQKLPFPEWRGNWRGFGSGSAGVWGVMGMKDWKERTGGGEAVAQM